MQTYKFNKLFNRYAFLIWLAFIFTIAACNLPTNSQDVPASKTQPLESSSARMAPSLTHTLRPTGTPEPTSTLTPTLTTTPTGTPTVTPLPTYTTLRGEVLVRANCRYGPGAPYLYKYGLVPGSNLEIIGRNDLGTWILVQAIGGDNPCWVKASLMEVKGDVMHTAPTYIPLPASPYYRPPYGVSATRHGDEVTISWTWVNLRAGDETAESPYLIEAWVCQDGQLIFTPIGPYTHIVTLVDETGCTEASHGRIAVAEKHGYSQWTEIPWPP